MRMTYLDNGFYKISFRDAIKLGKSPLHDSILPKHGMERAVEFEGKKYWLARTITHNDNGERIQVWSIRERI